MRVHLVPGFQPGAAFAFARGLALLVREDGTS